MLVSRIAPTPSGYLHIGNIYNFLQTRALVDQQGGELWLRIDDCDSSRVKTEYIKDIFITLEWLGIRWERGPRNYDDFINNYSQIRRKDYYFKKLQEIPHYVCNCSRKDIKNRGITGNYDGYCRNRKLVFVEGENLLRFESSSGNDFILWSRDSHPSYQLVSVIDDIDMGINFIVRGEDLRESTKMQQDLAAVLGKKFPEVIYHKLILDKQGKKLAKSNFSQSIKSLRESGMSPQEVLNRIPFINEREL